MTDISKCHGKTGKRICHCRNLCWRYVAPAGDDGCTWIAPKVPIQRRRCEQFVANLKLSKRRT